MKGGTPEYIWRHINSELLARHPSRKLDIEVRVWMRRAGWRENFGSPQSK